MPDKNAHEAELHYRSMVDEAVVGMLRTRADGGIEQANQELARMLGYESPEELLASVRAVHELYVDGRERARLFAELMGSGTLKNFETDFKRRDGSVVPVASSVRAIRDADGNLLGVEGVVIDRTDKLRAERALRETYEKQRELAERLQELVDTQDRLLNAVSHEMRTPLTSILGLSMTLARHGDQLDVEQRADLVDRVARNAKRLDRMLRGLLDLEGMRRGATIAAPVAVRIAELVEQSIAGMDLGSRSIGRAGVADVVVTVDPGLTQRILEILLANVARHTPETTHVTVGAHIDGGTLVLTVDDDGPGVPDAVKEAIFEAFKRGDPDEANPGIGIGLTLVRRFAELHDGTCWVEDRPDGGASFRVTLRSGSA